jgi:cytochrome c551/c552
VALAAHALRQDTAGMTIRPAALTFALLTWVVPQACAADSGMLAADHGCLNCHGISTHPHEALALKDLAAKLARRGDTPDALNHALQEMHEKGSVHGHRFASDEAALLILRWMAQGAKPP